MKRDVENGRVGTSKEIYSSVTTNEKTRTAQQFSEARHNNLIVSRERESKLEKKQLNHDTNIKTN